MENQEQLSFWKKAQIHNKNWVKNPGSRAALEFGPNLLEVRTCLEKSDKFPKILIWPDLPESEFRLEWLYEKIWSFHTSSIWLGLKVMNRGFEFKFKLNRAHVQWSTAVYKMKHCRLHISGYSETRWKMPRRGGVNRQNLKFTPFKTIKPEVNSNWIPLTGSLVHRKYVMCF
jgi:hypothetical protein